MIKYNDNKDVTIITVLSDDSFIAINNSSFANDSKLLCANDHAERVILRNNGFVAKIMPIILGVGTANQDFRNICNKYMHEVQVSINPVTGKKLDISFEYDIESLEHQDEIKLINKGGKIKTSEELATKVNALISEGKIEEIERYKYGMPININDYFIYIFSTYHSRVANKRAFIKKSANIEFYMITKVDVTNDKKKTYSINKRLRKALALLDEKPALMKHVTNVLDIAGETEVDLYNNVEIFGSSKPEVLIDAVNDNTLKDKSEIKDFIKSRLLRELPNTTTIIDANDPSRILGSNMTDVITFFNNDKNSDYVATMRSAYKANQLTK